MADMSISKLYDAQECSVKEIVCGGKTAKCISLALPTADGDDRRFVYMVCRRGIMCCKGFAPELFDDLGHAAAIFRAADAEDLLTGEVYKVNEHAIAMGIRTGMSGEEVFAIFNEGGPQ